MGEQAPALEILKYRRRQIADQVEAVQLVDDDDCDWEAIAAWCGGSLVNHEVADSGEYETRLILGDNHHGRRTGFAGEWVVTDGGGFFWLLLEDTFAETYEAGEAPPGTLQERIDGLAGALAKATGIIAERDRRIADYENAISWNTSCTSCAAVLDSSIRDHDRAERAEAQLAAIRRGVSPATVLYAEAAASDLAQELAERAESHVTATGSAGTGNARGDDGRGAQNRAEGRAGDAR